MSERQSFVISIVRSFQEYRSGEISHTFYEFPIFLAAICIYIGGRDFLLGFGEVRQMVMTALHDRWSTR